MFVEVLDLFKNGSALEMFPGALETWLTGSNRMGLFPTEGVQFMSPVLIENCGISSDNFPLIAVNWKLEKNFPEAIIGSLDVLHLVALVCICSVFLVYHWTPNSREGTLIQTHGSDITEYE